MNIGQAPVWFPSFLVPFVTLSYPIDPPAEPDSFVTSNYYSTGLLDGCFIISAIAVMAVLRDVTRIFVLEPFAHWYLTRTAKLALKSAAPYQNGFANGLVNGTSNGIVNGKTNGKANGSSNGHAHHTHPGLVNGNSNGPAKLGKKQERQIHRSMLRFGEQGWSAIYYSSQWMFGLYVHCNLPTAPFNPHRLWMGYPHVHLAGPVKFYYLTQTAFYLHQILIINAEERRKDHVQMMTHHIITVALMVASYFRSFTRIGCFIMVIMDWCDIWLPVAKMFRYLTFSTLCDVTFGFFTLSWLVTRHYFFLRVIWSTYHDAHLYITFGWAPEQGLLLTRGAFDTFIATLVALQVLQILWFRMIIMVVWRVVVGQGAEDTRSDDEGDEASDELEHTKPKEIPHQTDLRKRR